MLLPPRRVERAWDGKEHLEERNHLDRGARRSARGHLRRVRCQAIPHHVVEPDQGRRRLAVRSLAGRPQGAARRERQQWGRGAAGPAGRRKGRRATPVAGLPARTAGRQVGRGAAGRHRAAAMPADRPLGKDGHERTARTVCSGVLDGSYLALLDRTTLTRDTAPGYVGSRQRRHRHGRLFDWQGRDRRRVTRCTSAATNGFNSHGKSRDGKRRSRLLPWSHELEHEPRHAQAERQLVAGSCRSTHKVERSQT